MTRALLAALLAALAAPSCADGAGALSCSGFVLPTSTTARLGGEGFSAVTPADTGCPVPGSPTYHYAARFEATYADTDPVGSMTSTGNNTALLEQASATSRPTYVASCLNGEPCLDFDGSSDWLSTSGQTAMTQPNLICAVARFDAATSLVWDGEQGAVASNRAFLFSSSTPLFLFNGSLTVNSGLSLTVAQWDIYCATYDGASSVLRKSGVAGSTVSTGTVSLDGLTWGANAVGNGPFNGRQAEILVYDTAPAGGAADVEAYLECVYGAFPQ